MDAGFRRIIYSSSAGAAVGEPARLPVGEDHRVAPLSPYGVSKHTVGHRLESFHANDGIEYVALRYANVYGPRQDTLGVAGL